MLDEIHNFVTLKVEKVTYATFVKVLVHPGGSGKIQDGRKMVVCECVCVTVKSY